MAERIENDIKEGTIYLENTRSSIKDGNPQETNEDHGVVADDPVDDSRRLIVESIKEESMGSGPRGRSQRRRHFGACLKALCIGGQFPESETSSEACSEDRDAETCETDYISDGNEHRSDERASIGSSPVSDTLCNDMAIFSDCNRALFSDTLDPALDVHYSSAGTADQFIGRCENDDCYSEEGYESCRSSHDSLEAIGLCLQAMKVESETSLNINEIDSNYQTLLQLSSPTQEDREFNFLKTEVRRSTSLKSGKTPPGTPRKKVVRFADAMGLDLASVRHILDTDRPPQIPQSAIDDLKVGLEEELRTQGCRHLAPCFQQPGAEANFIDRIHQNKVCLENTLIDGLTVTGTIRVSNLSIHKAVNIRMTSDGWKTFFDIPASYVQNSCDGATDRFAFTLIAPRDFGVGGKIHFAIAFTCGGVTYWDNNHSTNYTFECYAKSYPSLTHLGMTFV